MCCSLPTSLHCFCFACCGTLLDVCLSAFFPPHHCDATHQTQSCHAGTPPPKNHTNIFTYQYHFLFAKTFIFKSWSGVSDNEKHLSYNIWKFQYLFMIRGKRVQMKTNFWNLQQFHQTCQTLVYGICRLEVWYTRSNRCSSQTPTVSHSTHRPAESESLPCSAPVEINL